MNNKPSWIGYKLSDRYVLEALLGQGGMSTVYRGLDPNLRRQVAVKLIHPHLANNPEFVRRFEEEAAAVASLRHPHIVQVYDFNHDHDTFYMVLEYVQGVTLEERLADLAQQGHRLSLPEVRRMMGEIITAVGYAHSQGMIHRDLKPANIMVRPDGSTTLMDFGVVKMLGGDQHTATGAVMGTISYMAPEQIKGLRADHRADLYALGAILYELVAGHRPFMGDNSASTMMMHLTQPVPDLRDELREVEPDMTNLGVLAEVVQKGMAKEPEERFQTAAQMWAALHGQEPPDFAPAEFASPDQTMFMPSTATLSGTPRFTQAAVPTGTIVNPPSPPESKRSYVPWLIGGVVGAIALIFLAFWLGGGGQLDVAASLSATATAEQALLLTLDRDQDGLPNAEELALGTDPDNPDSDGDGLDDGYEGRIPCLNPLEADVDGDGILDGEDDDPCTAALSPYQAQITDIRLVRIQSAPTGDDGYGYGEDPLDAPPPASEPEEVVRYEIAFTTTGFTPQPPSVADSHHVHFYFNSLGEDEAGLPGGGPWSLYAGGSPYVDPNNTPLARPEGATQLCVVVANANHTLVRNTSQCFDLPAPDAIPEESRVPGWGEWSAVAPALICTVEG
ncbi:MAG: protein kinase [Chloroflexi bacterium]|nr:protein kinase [Chloroflexota bacterium]